MFAARIRHTKDALLDGFDLAVEFATLGEYTQVQRQGLLRRADTMCPIRSENPDAAVERRTDVGCSRTQIRELCGLE